MSEFTEADRAKVLSVLTKITEDDKEKYHVYHDIYHVLKESCDCRIPENKILPEREDLLHFLHRKMLDHPVGRKPSSSGYWRRQPAKTPV
jgi:HSP90 family molecular chaperone